MSAINSTDIQDKLKHWRPAPRPRPGTIDNNPHAPATAKAANPGVAPAAPSRTWRTVVKMFDLHLASKVTCNEFVALTNAAATLTLTPSKYQEPGSPLSVPRSKSVAGHKDTREHPITSVSTNHEREKYASSSKLGISDKLPCVNRTDTSSYPASPATSSSIDVASMLAALSGRNWCTKASQFPAYVRHVPEFRIFPIEVLLVLSGLKRSIESLLVYSSFGAAVRATLKKVARVTLQQQSTKRRAANDDPHQFTFTVRLHSTTIVPFAPYKQMGGQAVRQSAMWNANWTCGVRLVRSRKDTQCQVLKKGHALGPTPRTDMVQWQQKQPQRRRHQR